jgi:acyl phosphate:glycerol-3-phosphate acyltransferase
MIHILFILVAYLIGSIPVGVLLARLKGRDPRKAGSGNIGATNVLRTAGKVLGIMTLLGDILKGFIPTIAALQWGEPKLIIAFVGFAVFFGHLFPLFLGFRGGKGVSTALGVYLALDPLAILISVIVFIVVFLVWRYVSVSSLTGAGIIPFTLILLNAPLEYIVLAFVVVGLMYIKHADNIRRLIAGTENKVNLKGSR